MKIKFDEYGQEIPDPKPVAIPSGLKRPETLEEQIQRLVRTQVSHMAAEQGAETFEDADDFDIDEDFDPSTPYETYFDPVLGKEITPHEFGERQAWYRKQAEIKMRQEFQQQDLEEFITKGQQPPQGRNNVEANSKTEPAASGEQAGEP